MVQIDLHFVDELVQARKAQHGGGRGAPLLLNNHRIGASINRSCMAMLSALLQGYVEEVFQVAAKRVFPSLGNDQKAFEDYWNQLKYWGNPSDANIKKLFLKIGIPDVMNNLSWQGTKKPVIIKRLDELNQIRNRIAHGGQKLSLNGKPYLLTLAKVVIYKNLVANFGARFEDHVIELTK